MVMDQARCPARPPRAFKPSGEAPLARAAAAGYRSATLRSTRTT